MSLLELISPIPKGDRFDYSKTNPHSIPHGESVVEYGDVQRMPEIPQRLTQILTDQYIQPNWDFDRLIANSQYYSAVFRNPLYKHTVDKPPRISLFINPHMVQPFSNPSRLSEVHLLLEPLNDILIESGLVAYNSFAHYNELSISRIGLGWKIKCFQTGVGIISGNFETIERALESIDNYTEELKDDSLVSELIAMGRHPDMEREKLEKERARILSRAPQNPKPFP